MYQTFRLNFSKCFEIIIFGSLLTPFEVIIFLGCANSSAKIGLNLNQSTTTIQVNVSKSLMHTVESQDQIRTLLGSQNFLDAIKVWPRGQTKNQQHS